MSQAWRILICAMALIGGLTAGATPARGADKDSWTVIFRSDDPMLWKHPGGTPSMDNGFAAPQDSVSEKMHYLRLKRMDTGDAVIVAVTKLQLQQSGKVDGDLCWNGNARVRGKEGEQNLVLGISRISWVTVQPDDQLVYRKPGGIKSGYRGWGFSTPASADQKQTYSWAGQPIKKTVFEIAVTASDLTDDEKSHLLDPKANGKSDTVVVNQGSTQPTPADAKATAQTGPTTKLSRRQASIHVLYVITEASAQKLGEASEMILTATPGKSSGQTIPISYTAASDPQMRAVLDDVVRAMNANYPHLEASKFELSFADRFPKEGPSIGAAIGTLMLSMIEGYDIDPKLAITGDVSSDAKVRKIGGVSAKIRGATGAGCAIVAMPSENYEQVQDAMVYEGMPLIVNINVMGIGSLDEAAAVARVDRPQKLVDALKLFGEVQEVLKKTPEKIHSKEIHDKLATAADLAPNDYSVKLLLLASQDKQPKRLTPRATMYYTSVAMNEVTPTLLDRSKHPGKTQISSSVVEEGLRRLDKVKRIGEPKMLAWVESCRNCIRELNDVQQGNGSVPTMDLRRQQMMDQAAKLDMDRDLTEQMQREGI